MRSETTFSRDLTLVEVKVILILWTFGPSVTSPFSPPFWYDIADDWIWGFDVKKVVWSGDTGFASC